MKTKKKRFSPKMNTFPQIQVKTKKKVFTKNGSLFFPDFKWTLTLRCTPESNYWGRGADLDHIQTTGGYSQIIGGIYPTQVSVPLIRSRGQCVSTIGAARIFDWGAQITCNDVIRNFQKRKFLRGKDIVEWKI